MTAAALTARPWLATARAIAAGTAALLAASLASAEPAAAQDDGPGSRIGAEFVRPALAALAGSAAAAQAAIGTLCAQPSTAALAAARDAFGEVAIDWGRVTVLRFGSLAADNRFERLFFFPDPRGIALRQVQGLLAERDEGSTTAAGLGAKSVALQGLPALEFVLFDGGAAEMTVAAEGFRCRYARAVAGNVATIAAEVLAGWRDDTAFARSFAAPGAGRDPYRSVAEVDAEIVKALSTVLQYVRTAEILPPLGEGAGHARGRRAPLWRSGLTFRLIVAQIEGARELLGLSGYADSLPAGSAWIVGSIDLELRTAARMLGDIGTPPELAFQDETERGRIGVANLALDHAGQLVSEQLAAALGLGMGFNALDGD